MKDIFVNFKKTGIISVCFLSSLLSGYSQRIVVSPIIPGGGSSGSLTGSYTFTSPISEAAGVVSLPLAIANLNTNTPNTNKWNAWQFWCDPVSTNTYHAENRGLGIKTNSTDFSALLQSILNRGTEGFSFKFEPNPFYTNAYVMTNTVVVTNWGTWSGDLAGNPTVVFRAASGLAGPLFQLGDYGKQIGGISGWRDIRFEGDNGATNCVGVELRNVVEPIFAFCEFTGFKAAGIRVANTNAMYWTYVDNCWFVQKWNSSQGITFTRTPIENQSQCHFRISGSTFGGTGGNGIIVSNWFPSLNISGNKFFGLGMNDGIGIYAGEDLTIANNDFQNLSSIPIYFYDQATATNFSSSVTANTMSGDGPVVVLGDKVQGVFMSGNSSATGGDPIQLVGNNGFPVNFDRAELRLGFLPVTNRVLFADANGKVTYVTGSSAETEYVKKDGTVGTPSGGGGSTNTGRFFYGFRLGAHTVTARSNALGWVTSTMSSNFTANAATTIITNTVAGYYEISAGYGFYSVSNNVFAVKVTTNGAYADNLIAYEQYSGGTGAASIATNSVAVLGVVYLPANGYVSVYSDYTKNLTGEIAYEAINEYLIIRPVDSPGGGDVTVNNYGSGSTNMVTAEIGRLNITNGLVMNGTAIPLFALPSYQSDAMAFTRATNSPAATGSTNDLQISRSSATAGQVLTLHSTASGQHVWTNATPSASGGGSTTNVPPVVLAINGGTGTTNVIVDMWVLAQMSTNSVQITLTANAGIIVTNVVAGKELVIDVIQDSTGNRTIAASSVGGAPLRFGTDITGFGLSTNGTYIDHVKLRGVGTNAHVVGMIRGYAP